MSMKMKSLLSRTWLIALGIGAFTLASCTEKGNLNDDEQVKSNDNITVTVGEDMSGDGSGAVCLDAKDPLMQQMIMQSVADELMTCVSMGDFDYYNSLSNCVDQDYGSTSRCGIKTPIVNNCFGNMMSAITMCCKPQPSCPGTQPSQPEIDGPNAAAASSTDNTHYLTDFNLLYVLTNLKGHFTAGDDGWDMKPAANLQFTFTDQDGAKAVLKVLRTGKTKNVRMYDSADYSAFQALDLEQWLDMPDYTFATGTPEDGVMIDVPEKITVTYSAGGKERISVEVKTNLNTIKEETLYRSLNAVTASSTVKMGDYSFFARNILTTTGKQAGVEYSVSKKNKVLVTECVSADNWQESDLKGTIDDLSLSDIVSKMASAGIRINILQKMQMNIKINDGKAIKEAINAYNANIYSETVAKNSALKFNANAFGGIYYNAPGKQASFRLEPFSKEYRTWYGTTYIIENQWQLYPVFAFGNSTSYSLMEGVNFFGEDNFKNVLDPFESLLNIFGSMRN